MTQADLQNQGSVFPKASAEKPITSICLPPFLLLTLLTKPKAFKDVFSNNWTCFFQQELSLCWFHRVGKGQAVPTFSCSYRKCTKTLSNCSSGASLHLFTRNFRSGFTSQSHREGQRWGNGGEWLINVKIHHAEILFNHLLFHDEESWPCLFSSFHALTSSCQTCLKTKWINPGAVNKTCDPPFCVSMLLLDKFFFYRTTSSTSQLRNQETVIASKQQRIPE